MANYVPIYVLFYSIKYSYIELCIDHNARLTLQAVLHRRILKNVLSWKFLAIFATTSFDNNAAMIIYEIIILQKVAYQSFTLVEVEFAVV